jgi:hypothetical protein
LRTATAVEIPFSDRDVVRVHLIRDLKGDLGVNDEGVGHYSASRRSAARPAPGTGGIASKYGGILPLGFIRSIEPFRRRWWVGASLESFKPDLEAKRLAKRAAEWRSHRLISETSELALYDQEDNLLKVLSQDRVSYMTDTLDEGARRKLPRLLSRSQAANYCNVYTTTFSNWVRSEKLPPPLPGTKRWDVKAIDFALDAISGPQSRPETSALDEWRARRGRRHERNQ